MASFLDISGEIAREAGALLLKYRGVGFEIKGESDLVTEADRASERLIVERLHTHFPAHNVVAEEGGGQETSSEYRWYVDPLDGTTNFAHGFPVYNVTLALERAGELICGVVYDPTRDEMFAAEKGAGAHLNNRRIRVTETADLEEALIGTGFPSRRRHLNVNIHFYYQLAMITHGVRRAGAAAIDLAYVACGRLDAFWEFKLNPWDVAAGVLLIQEAGGICSDMRGNPMTLHGPHILAASTAMHPKMLQFCKEVFEGVKKYPLPEIQAES